MPWQKAGAFLREEKQISHIRWLYLVVEPSGDTSSRSAKNGQNEKYGDELPMVARAGYRH